MYDSKGDKLFRDWMTKVEKIAKLTLCLEILLGLVKADDIVYKVVKGKPH